ncbi:MAG: DNA polymerase III subunit gamma/tau [Thermodesulfobacteriota bacterium]|nr:DNA polymerase III subunit gamma/tau [Thermodesulfobacteriota bacterium]
MSYLVLARKYRPQTFEEVVEQQQVTRTLTNAIASGRVAHAILFTGPRGTGKTTIARILAKAMNCEKGPTPTPCCACRSCLEIASGNATDVFEIDGASNNSVDQVRELRGNVKFMPAHSPYKIYIIDEVHMLSGPAFNALLKTLEEPPAHVMFFFATTEPHKIPVTILSRCQRHDLSLVGIDPLVAHLETLCEKENIPIEKKSLELIAHEAGGSVRDSLSLLDQVMSSAQGPVSHEMVLESLGIIDREVMFGLSGAVLTGDMTGALDILDTVYRGGHDIKRFYAEMLGHFRDLLMVKLGVRAERLASLPGWAVEKMQAQTRDVTELFLNQALALMLAEEDRVRFSSQSKIAVEMVFVKLLHTKPVLPIDTLIQKVDALRKSFAQLAGSSDSPAAVPENAPRVKNVGVDTGVSASRPAQARPAPTGNQPRPAPPPPASPPSEETGPAPGTTDPGPLDNAGTWEAILARIDEQYPLLGANLRNSTLAAMEGNRLEIKVYGSQTSKAILAREQSMENLKQVCCDFFKTDINLAVTYTCDTQPAQPEKQKLRAADPDPLVAEALNIFGGTIVNT